MPSPNAPVTNKPWDGSSARYRDADHYCESCLIDTNAPSEEKIVAKCRLPVYEPTGEINRNAVVNAAARFNQVNAPREIKLRAARALVRLYGRLELEPPDVVKDAAGMRTNAQAMNERLRQRER